MWCVIQDERQVKFKPVSLKERELTCKGLLYITEKKIQCKAFLLSRLFECGFFLLLLFFNKRLSFSLQAVHETVISIYCPKSAPDVHYIILLALLAKPFRSCKPVYQPLREVQQFTPLETLL